MLPSDTFDERHKDLNYTQDLPPSSADGRFNQVYHEYFFTSEQYPGPHDGHWYRRKIADHAYLSVPSNLDFWVTVDHGRVKIVVEDYNDMVKRGWISVAVGFYVNDHIDWNLDPGLQARLDEEDYTTAAAFDAQLNPTT